jgi:hypothetical protein
VVGSCQISLFDENFLARQGICDLRLWPYESFKPRMVCQGVCYSRHENETFCEHTMSDHMTLNVMFQSFGAPVGWRLDNKKVAYLKSQAWI